MNAVNHSLEKYGTHGFASRAQNVMIKGNTRSTVFVSPAPPYAVSGTGCEVTDQFGHIVVDCNNNYTSLIHGHATEQINEAVTELIKQGTAFGLPTESEVALAETLKERTGHEKWRFSNSGTEAVMTAIRACRAFTGRNKIIRFEGSYHGTSDPVAPFDSSGITEGTKKDILVVQQANIEAFDRAIAEVGNDLAGVLIDLMPNRAGLIPAETEYVKHIRETTERVGALMIVDEVISLRLAYAGFASEYTIRPDLVTAGKIIGGGFPVGAVGGRTDVLAVFDPSKKTSVGWGGTFSANPVSMTAGKIALDLFDKSEIKILNTHGEKLRNELIEAGIKVTGFGSLMRLREETDLSKLWWAAYNRGVMLGTNGLLALSTTMTDAHIAEVRDGVIGAVQEVREGKN